MGGYVGVGGRARSSMRLVRLKPQGQGPGPPGKMKNLQRRTTLGPEILFKCSKPRSTYKAFQLALFWSKLCKNSFFSSTTFLSKRGNSKNRTKIRSILQMYVRGARSRFYASGPGGTMIRPSWEVPPSRWATTGIHGRSL